MAVDLKLLEHLAAFDTPTICNALEVAVPQRRGYGYSTKPFVCAFPAMKPIVGFARTSTIRAREPSTKSPAEARALIDRLELRLFQTRLGSAHVMGGCAMGEDAKSAVTDSLGRHHQLENLSIHDGSLFPTSIGANPQLSIYGLTAKLATLLAERLKA